MVCQSCPVGESFESGLVLRLLSGDGCVAHHEEVSCPSGPEISQDLQLEGSFPPGFQSGNFPSRLYRLVKSQYICFGMCRIRPAAVQGQASSASHLSRSTLGGGRGNRSSRRHPLRARTERAEGACCYLLCTAVHIGFLHIEVLEFGDKTAATCCEGGYHLEYSSRRTCICLFCRRSFLNACPTSASAAYVFAAACATPVGRPVLQAHLSGTLIPAMNHP